MGGLNLHADQFVAALEAAGYLKVLPVPVAYLMPITAQLVGLRAAEAQRVGRLFDFFGEASLHYRDAVRPNLDRRVVAEYEIEVRVCIPRFHQIVVRAVVLLVERDEHFLLGHDLLVSLRSS